MKRKTFQRLIALLLTFMMLLGGSVSAAAEGGSVTDTTIESMKDLLGAVSYEDYCEEYYQKDKDGRTLYLDKNGNVVTYRDGVFRDKNDNIVDKNDCYPVWTVGQAKQDVLVDITNINAENTTANAYIIDSADEKGKELLAKNPGTEGAVYCPETGDVSWTVTVPEAGRYTIKLEYYPIVAKNTSIGRIFKINGEIPFAEARYLTMSKIYKQELKSDWAYTINGYDRYFDKDKFGNETRPGIIQAPEWREYIFKDSDGYSSEAFEFVFEAGENVITLSAVNEPVAIRAITLCAPETTVTYNEYLQSYANTAAGQDKVTVQAELLSAVSSQTVYPIEDRASAFTQPSSTKQQLLNTIGGEKWQVAGQWVRYDFTVNSDGMYEIVTRFKQNLLDGMYSSRELRIYSHGLNPGDKGYYNGTPFAEASDLRFGFNNQWQTGALYFLDENGNAKELELFFKAGVEYSIEFEVTLGDMGDIVRRTQDSLTAINEAYLNILKLTGTSPDPYREYGFFRVMPGTLIEMNKQSTNLYNIAAELAALNGEKSSNTATLEKVADLLHDMGTNEDDIARNLSRLKSYIGTLGTWISDAKTQPLQLDYILIQGSNEEVPKANPNFWQALVHEMSSFIQSFFRDYNHMGAKDTPDVAGTDGESLEVWLAYGRDQTQVIRTLINNDFTPNSGVTVDLKLVAGGTLLPSILAKMGPDVYIGIGQGDIINYAIRGALLDIKDCSGFYDTALNPETRNFNDAAMEVLKIADREGVEHYYGLPETQDFPMMFVRTDILADLNVEIPKTWDDLLAVLPMLQANNMEIGLSADSNVYLYQMGGTLFADGGMRINLDSNVGLEAFSMMCDMYTMYSFPYSYNFSNRFRTGEMPIGIGGYCGTYNTLVVFATEIRGLWQFFPLPGIEDENGNINNVSVSSVSAVSMINNCSDTEKAWKFMEWQTGADFQAQYSNEMIAILGDSAKHATANMKALDELTWTQAELTEIKKQFNNLASVPNYPGAYIVGRYTSFAFLAAYNNMKDPTTELLSYINTINKEISRKRDEFGLETLEVGQTLAGKRLDEATALLNDIKETGAYADAINAALKAINAVPSENKSGVDQYIIDNLNIAKAGLEAADKATFANAIVKLEDAINALISYNVYY